MALLDFPTGPNTNDTTTQNGNTWKWNGTSWVAFNNLSLSSQVSGILAVQYGGTGFGGTYTAGDILYALSSNTFGKLAAGTAGSVLASGGPSTAPYWKVDEAGSGSVGNGNTGGFAYYTNVNNVTSGTAFSYISGTNNVILTNGTLSLTGSTVNSGTWAGNAITAKYGGTGLNTIAVGELIYGSGTDTFARLSAGAAGSILVATTGSGVAWTAGSNLAVGTASTSTTAINLNTYTLSGTMYLTGQTSSTGGVGASQFVGSGISFVSSTGLLTATTFSGTATSAAQVNTEAVTVTRYLVGTALNTASGSTQLSTGSGITIGNNVLTATTFQGSLSGTASTSTTAVNLNTYTLSGTMYLTGQTSSTGGVGTSQFVGSGISFVSATGLLTATTFSGTATSAAQVNTEAVTATRYIVGTVLNTASGSTQLSTGSGITIGNNVLTATTFQGSLTGTASTSTTAVNLNTYTLSGTMYLTGQTSSTGGVGTSQFVGSGISFVSATGLLTATTFSGTATSAAQVNTEAVTATRYLVGTALNTASGSTQLSTGSGITIGNNVLTATTFQGSLSGTASTSTTAVNLNTYALSGTMYLTGQAASGGAVGSSQLVASGLSFASSTGTLGATFYTGSGIQLSGIVTSLAASTGISVNSATGAVTVTNTGVISLTGTANQVLVAGGSGSATSGNITLTLPQSIASTSSPSFADVTLTTGSNSTLATVGSQPTSMVNKQYVDNLAAGLDIHESMRVLQQPVLSANYVQTEAAGSAATSAYLISTSQVALPAIDGITISATGASQRVLVVGGFNGTASIAGTTPFTPANSFIGNGSYFVVALGGLGTSNWILRRTTDADDNVELTGGTFTFIEEGTSYSDSGWVCSNDTLNLGSIQFGSTAITFTQFTGGGAIGVGQGLTKVGNTVATKVNLFSTGTASGTGFTQFNIGGAGSAGVADTGYYPTFTVRTSGTVAGTAVLTLNSDGFSLVGSTSSNRTITVTGSDITLTGGGNTLTLTGSISLPSPTQYGIAYGSSATAVAFLTAGGTGASVLTQTLNNNPVYLGQSQLVVGGATTAGIATSAAQVNTDAVTATRYLVGTVLNTASGSTQLSTGSGITIGNNVLTATTFQGSLSGTASTATTALNLNTYTLSGTMYLTGQTSSTGGVGASQFVASGISFVSSTGLLTATTFSGTATSAAQVNTDAVTATRYLVGTVLNTASGSTQLSTGSGITIGDNRITATTFQGSLSGTASTSTTAINLNTYSLSGTMYLTGQTSSTGGVGASQFVASGISFVSSTGLLTATTFSGTATSAAQVNTDAVTATRYLVGTVLNTASGSTQLSTGSGITIGNNVLTATTFQGSLSGTASTSTTALNVNTDAVTATRYLVGTVLNTASGSTQLSTGSGITIGNNVLTATTFQGSLSGTASTSTTAINLNTYSLSGTMYLTGQTSSSGGVGTSQFVASGISFVSSTGLLTATTFSGTATSAAQVNTDAVTATRYLVGTVLNTASGSTQLSTGSGITIGNNVLTATTFQGSLSGTASTANRVGITTTVSNSDLPIVFASEHQPSAALGSSTRLTINPSTGKITNGFWAGTAITTPYGGTGLNTVNANQVLIGASTGNTWAAIASTNLPVAAISTTPPTQPGGAIGGTQPGQLWWDSEYGVLKVYYNDGNTSQWVDATPVLGSSGGGSSTKRSYVMTFGAGFTPSTGADTVQILIPYAPDNTSKYYFIKRLDYRANTAGTGVSFYIERFTGGNAAFDVSSGNRIHSASGASFVAASGIFITSYTQSSSGASFVSSSGIAGSILSGDYLRLNYSHINSAATMSVSIIIEEQ
jgi:autotransporter family porin